jgi:hypothetical protein
MTRILADFRGFFFFWTEFKKIRKKNPRKSARIRVIRVPIRIAPPEIVMVFRRV